MAGGAGTWRVRRAGGAVPRRWLLAALAHRRGQAIGVLALSVLVGACIVLVPLATRSLEQGVVKPAVTLQAPAASALVVDAGARVMPAAELTDALALLPPATQAVYPRGITELRATGLTPVFPAPARPNEAQLLVRDDVCAHLSFDAGRCPQASGEIAISAQDAQAYRWDLGGTHPFLPPVGNLDPRRTTGLTPAGPTAAPVPLTVVGIYRQVPDERYWLGVHLGGNRAIILDQGVKLDPFIASPATLGTGWTVTALAEYPADAEALTVELLPAAMDGIAAAQRAAPSGVVFRRGLEGVRAEAASSAEQIRLIVPLVLGQLAALVVAILYAVARAAAQERRGEAALARLRGGGIAGARRLLMGELIPPVLAGVLLGALAAVGLDAGLRAWVLPAGVPPQVGAPVVVALIGAAVVATAAVAVAVRPIARAPVLALLQRLPQRAARAGVGTWVVVALAGAAVLAVRSTSEPTPLALAAPTLLALALGLIGVAVLARLGPAAALRAWRRGRPAAGVGWAGAARRPAGRLVVVAVAVATAAAVVAVNSAVVGARNRALRAELEAGAPRALRVATQDLAALVGVLAKADPSGRQATVVTLTRPTDANAPTALGVDPVGLRGVVFASALSGADLDALGRGDGVPPLRLTGTTLSMTVRAALSAEPAFLPRGGVADQAELDQWGLRVVAVVTVADGQRYSRPLGVVPLRTTSSAQITGPLLCRDCRLDRLTFGLAPLPGREPLGPVPATLRGGVVLSDMTLDGRRIGPGPAEEWQSWVDPDDPSAGAVTLRPDAGPGEVSLDVTARSGAVSLPRADVPEPLPALVVGLPDQGTVQAKGLTEAMVPVRRVGRAEQLPVLGERGILYDRTRLGLRGARLGSHDGAEVWLARDAGEVEASVRAELARAGLVVTGERDAAALRARYDASGSAWGLTLALVAAALSLLLAAGFVAVSATLGWRRAATDIAVLRLAGVRAGLLRAASVRERLVVVLLGALLGGAAGLLGGALVMPLFPLFARPAARPVPDLAPDPVAVAGTWALALAVLVAVAVLAGLVVARRAAAALVQEDA